VSPKEKIHILGRTEKEEEIFKKKKTKKGTSCTSDVELKNRGKKKKIL